MTSYDDREWLRDRLAILLGRFAESRWNPLRRSQRSAEEWLFRETREELSAAEQARLDERARRFTERLMPRLVAARLGVRDAGYTPEFRAPALRGTAAQVLEFAADSRLAPYAPLAVAAGAGFELWDAVCEEWVDLPPELPNGKYVALKASGESMLPLLHSSDILLVQLGTRLVVDTVIVARVPDDGYVVKRVAQVDRRGMTLASLNAGYPPIRIAAGRAAVLGTVVARWCPHPRE